MTSGGFSSDRYPRCPLGHPLHTAQFISEAITTCKFRDHRGAAPCGIRCYVVKLVRYGEPNGEPRDDVVWYVTAIDVDVKEQLRKRSTWLERLVWAGVTVPNVEYDVGTTHPNDEEAA